MFADGVQVASTSAKAVSDGTAQIAFKETFLLTGSKAALPTGEQHSFTVRYTVDGTTYEVPIKPLVDEAPPEAQDQQLKEDLELAPFNDTAMFLGITVPENWPIIGGHRLQLWKPMLPFDIAFDPFGFIRIKATTPEWGYIRDNGKPDPNGWKFHPRASAKSQYEKLQTQMDEQLVNTFAAEARGQRGERWQRQWRHEADVGQIGSAEHRRRAFRSGPRPCWSRWRGSPSRPSLAGRIRRRRGIGPPQKEGFICLKRCRNGCYIG